METVETMESVMEKAQAAAKELDEVYESATIQGLMAITWRDTEGNPIIMNGAPLRGLPEPQAKDFWQAYGQAKKEGLERLRNALEESAVAREVVSEQMESAEPASKPEVEAEPVLEVIPLRGRVSAKERRRAARATRRQTKAEPMVVTNGVTTAVMEVEQGEDETKVNGSMSVKKTH